MYIFSAKHFRYFGLNLALLTVFFHTALGQTVVKTDAILSGKVPKFKGELISLQFFSTSVQTNIDQLDLQVSDEGYFKTTVPLMEDQIAFLFLGSDIIKIHLKPKDSIYIDIQHDNAKRTQTFYGKGAKDAAWPEKQKTQFEYTFESPSFTQTILEEMSKRTPSGFKNYLDSVIAVKLKYLKQEGKGLSPEFINWQTAEIKYEWEAFKINYPTWFYSMRGINDKSLDVDSTYYDYLKSTTINNPAYLSSVNYRTWLKYYFMYQIKLAGRNFGSAELYQFTNQFFKGEVLPIVKLNLWADVIQYGHINDAKTIYSLAQTELSKYPEFAILEARYKEKLPFTEGALAPPFTLRNIDGGKVSLGDYKGKVVYLDFWASWCGPCMREVPAGEELKKQFANADVVFLNISIDEDEGKWRESVRRNQISGTHLIANSSNNPDVLQAYKISSIPAYFLIGKDGRFIASPAPRPSSTYISQLLEAALKK
jgi:thiol-disulfide isomerase/thioredoxin